MLVRLTVRRPILWRLLADLLIATGSGAALYSTWSLSDGAAYQHAQRAEFIRTVMVQPPAGAEESGPETVPPPEPANAAIPQRSAARDERVFGQLKIPNVILTSWFVKGWTNKRYGAPSGVWCRLQNQANRGTLCCWGIGTRFSALCATCGAGILPRFEPQRVFFAIKLM